MERALSIFVDESGDTGAIKETSKYYIVSLVMHNQNEDISSQLRRIEHYPPFHIGPLIRNEVPYDNISVRDRAKLLRSFLIWSTTVPYIQKTFLYKKKELGFDKFKLLMRLSKDIHSFLIKNKNFFSSFDKIFVYYDKGQQIVDKALLQSFGIAGLDVNFKKGVKSENYRLFQLADFICSMKLIENKIENNELSNSEKIFFNDPRSFKKFFIKSLNRKELK